MAPSRPACAAFRKESRMKFASAPKVYRNPGDPDFLYVAPSRPACAAFRKESRMKFASAPKVYRKSGGAPPALGASTAAHRVEGRPRPASMWRVTAPRLLSCCSARSMRSLPT